MADDNPSKAPTSIGWFLYANSTASAGDV